MRKTSSLNSYMRKVNSGVGLGEGMDYKPWIRVGRGTASEGNLTRTKSITVGREHHVLSNYERQYLLILDWDDAVLDIREQYPILDIVMTVSIANKLGINHPVDKKTNFPRVLTSDFFLMVKKEDTREFVVRTFKPYKKLKDKRTVELLRIEQAYYEMLGYSWHVVTEKNLNAVLISNIKDIHKDFQLKQYPRIGITKRHFMALSEEMKQRLLHENRNISEIVSDLSNNYKLETAIFYDCFRHLLATKQLILDMKKIRLSDRLNYFSLLTVGTGWNREKVGFQHYTDL